MQNQAGAKRRSRKRGAVMVEYAFLLVAVVVPSAIGMLSAGVKLQAQYIHTRAAILAPTP
jgi:Flp pilus assembly pilin Flp